MGTEGPNHLKKAFLSRQASYLDATGIFILSV